MTSASTITNATAAAPHTSSTAGALTSPPAGPRHSLRDYTALAARVKAAAAPPLSWRVYGHQETPDGSERYELLIVRISGVVRHARESSAPSPALRAASPT